MRRLRGEGLRSYLGRSRLVAERPTGMIGSEKSAEVVVAKAGRTGCRPRRRAEREGQSRDMTLGGAMHQKAPGGRKVERGARRRGAVKPRLKP